ncbi:hypothetical protein A5706_09835 [Mycobacterium sp. E796]|nr:hypothetical protein A5706_09835 [Mycobacterium sp. E796]
MPAFNEPRGFGAAAGVDPHPAIAMTAAATATNTPLRMLFTVHEWLDPEPIVTAPPDTSPQI